MLHLTVWPSKMEAGLGLLLLLCSQRGSVITLWHPNPYLLFWSLPNLK